MPYFSYMCLVSGVAGGRVMFDPAVGCDQVIKLYLMEKVTLYRDCP